MEYQTGEKPTQVNKSWIIATVCLWHKGIVCEHVLSYQIFFVPRLSSTPKILNTEDLASLIHLNILPVIFKWKLH